MSVSDQQRTSPPEGENRVSQKLAGLVARARKEDCLTNVIGFVDEELRNSRTFDEPGVGPHAAS